MNQILVETFKTIYLQIQEYFCKILVLRLSTRLFWMSLKISKRTFWIFAIFFCSCLFVLFSNLSSLASSEARVSHVYTSRVHISSRRWVERHNFSFLNSSFARFHVHLSFLHISQQFAHPFFDVKWTDLWLSRRRKPLASKFSAFSSNPQTANLNTNL